MTNKERILEISKKLKLSHIGSNLSCLPILEEIYAKKKPKDIVILDNAHAHLAHLLFYNHGGIYMSNEGIEEFIKRYGIHCDRQAGCDASGGSLGHGLGIGIGYALSDRKRDVYVIVSDGSMNEGSNWEALRLISDLKIDNIKVYLNANGYTAVAKSDTDSLVSRMKVFKHDVIVRHTDNGEGFEGVEGHYKTI